MSVKPLLLLSRSRRKVRDGGTPSPASRRLALPGLGVAALVFLTFAPFVSAQQPNPLDLLTQLVAKTDDAQKQLNLLRGMNAALKGKRDVAAPTGWAALYEKLKTSPNEDVRQQAQSLAAIFGGGGVLEEMRKILGDAAAKAEARQAALESLASAKDAAAIPALFALIKEPGPLRRPALRSLAGFDDARIPAAVLASYASFDSDEKRDALAALLSRPEWALALLSAIDEKRVVRSELNATLARQLQDFKNPVIDAWLAKNWGAVRVSSADKQKEIARFKTFLTDASFVTADPSRGRALFSQTCLSCHAIFGSGGTVGPHLTGAYNDTDYLLQNILDPNALIGLDYQQTIVTSKNGQTISGILSGDDGSAVTLKTLAGPFTIQRGDIAELKVSEVSMMPEGLLSALADDEVRDLFAYLRQHGQVPMLANAINVNDFFNGADLSRWHASRGDAWRIENGELTGRGGAQRPEFLVSDLVAADFDFTAQVQLRGANAVGEIAVRGEERDGVFEGRSVSFGGNAPVNLWKYRGPKPETLAGKVAVRGDAWTRLEITARGEKVRLVIAGESFEITDPARRTVFAFYVFGEGAELRVKDVKLVLP